MTENTNSSDLTSLFGPGEAALQSLLESLDECVFVLGGDGRHLAVNRGFCAWLGRPESEVLGRTAFDLWPADLAERDAADLLRILAGERLETEEVRPRAGQPCTVRTLKVPLRDDQGIVRGLLGRFHDVTQEGRPTPPTASPFRPGVKGIAHDLRNLITALQCALPLADTPDPQARREWLALAEKTMTCVVELTERILEPAPSGAARPLDLNVLVGDVLRLVGPMLGPGIVTQIHRAGDLPPVQGDASQLVQALLNLCLNARDAMPTGGHLALETAFLTIGPDEAAGHPGGRPGSFVRLGVSDSGHGMEPEVRAHIFEPFFTTKEPGTSQGLGLAIVAYVARRHRGWVECTSVPGQGTRFDLYLPTTPAQAQSQPAVPARAPGGETILVVDNDQHILRLARAILEMNGYRVRQAESGSQAIEVYRQGGIDLVLLDQNMPGLSGADTLTALRNLDPAASVLLASGFTLDEIPPSTRARLRGFLSKPYRPDDLLQAVRSALLPSGGSPQAGV